MNVDDSRCSSSDDETVTQKIADSARHSAVVRLDLETEDIAETVLRVLSVDKEPSRSNALRSFSLEGSCLQITITALDRKSLQRSLANVFDMCDLAKSTIDVALRKSWTSIREPAEKKPKLNCGS